MFLNLGKFLDDNSELLENENKNKFEILFFVKNYLSKINFNTTNEVPYGRYLAYESKKLNIQVDVFSKSYEGNVHIHDTWGILGVINGSLLVKDWQKNLKDENMIDLTREYLLSKSATCYFTKSSDIHSTQTFDGPQVVSIHVYGKEFNLDKGYKYSFDHQKWIKYDRGMLRDFKQIQNHFI